jgi:hypothetical protein
MDDRELETRLRTHLHRTLDDAQPSLELRASVEQVFATPVRRVGLFDIRGRGLGAGWGLAAAAVVVAVVAISANVIRLGPAPGAQQTTAPSPVPTLRVVAPERRFVVVPPAGGPPGKADTSLAVDVLTARLHALGFDGISSAAGFGLEFDLPADGPNDESVRRVLAAIGDVEFVPVPPQVTAEVGKPLPTDEPALFGWEGVESVAWGTDQQDRRTLNFDLMPAARQAFADYSASHTQEYLAVVVDGRVALLPVINEPIPGGEVQISGGSLPGSPETATFTEVGAILIGGMVPDRWRGATSPEIIPRDEAISIAVARWPGATVGRTNLYFVMHGAQPEPIWSVVMENAIFYLCEGPGGQTNCPGVPTELRIVATTGEVLTLQDWDDAAEPSSQP